MKISDRLLGPAISVSGVGVIWAAKQLPTIPGVRFGADLMPLICGVLLVFLGLSLTRTSWKGKWDTLFSMDEWSVSRSRVFAALWAILGLVAGIYLFEPLGFPLFGIVYMGGLMWLMQARPLLILIVSPAFVLLMYFVFTKAMFIDVPAGILGGLL